MKHFCGWPSSLGIYLKTEHFVCQPISMNIITTFDFHYESNSRFRYSSCFHLLNVTYIYHLSASKRRTIFSTAIKNLHVGGKLASQQCILLRQLKETIVVVWSGVFYFIFSSFSVGSCIVAVFKFLFKFQSPPSHCMNTLLHHKETVRMWMVFLDSWWGKSFFTLNH